MKQGSASFHSVNFVQGLEKGQLHLKKASARGVNGISAETGIGSHENLVLVKSQMNKAKDADLSSAEIQSRIKDFWVLLKKQGLISARKHEYLTKSPKGFCLDIILLC